MMTRETYRYNTACSSDSATSVHFAACFAEHDTTIAKFLLVGAYSQRIGSSAEEALTPFCYFESVLIVLAGSCLLVLTCLFGSRLDHSVLQLITLAHIMEE